MGRDTHSAGARVRAASKIMLTIERKLEASDVA
jgi:hypothetical protein